MKKLLIVLGALSLLTSFNTKIQATEDPDKYDIVCFYVEDEEGNLEYVCEEEPIVQPYVVCSPECWGV